MKRDILKQLHDWKNDPSKRPLLLRGARQTGKTYIVNEFGKNEFRNYVYVNFEKMPELKNAFTSRKPSEIIKKITLLTNKAIHKGNTLLFLDEIQDCPEAIISLRYFYEDMPELHIIGAGSLLEFALSSKDFKMPVGRIQYLYLYPLSFGEFMDACNASQLREHIAIPSNIQKLEPFLHEKLISLIKDYFVIGGMPAVVQEYINSGDIYKCKRLQSSIIETYTDDFAKYSKSIKHRNLKKVLSSLPRLVGKKLVYAQIDRDIKSRELKEAVDLLETAGIIHRVWQTSGAELPLAAGAHDAFFKIIAIDTGLLNALSGAYSDIIQEPDLTAVYRGTVAEQFVGQELIAYQSPYTKAQLYYWGRKAKSSTAELDYLISRNENIIPIEVKSGSTGRMKSMHMFLEHYESKLGVKISQDNYKDVRPIMSLPFYAIQPILFNSSFNFLVNFATIKS